MPVGFGLTAPGINNVRLTKLRPLSGNDVSFVEPKLSPVDVDSVCKVGAISRISTVSVGVPTSSLVSMRAI